jgi:hypothetical protein
MAQQVIAVVQQSFVAISDDGQDIALPGNSGSATQTLDHTHQAPSGNSGSFPSINQSTNSLRIQGPGRNFGNAGGWSTGSSEYTPELAVSQRGIHQHKAFVLKKHAVGDTAGIYGYIWSDGGVHGQSDEGVTAMTLELNEFPGYFHGQVVSSTGKGDTKPVFKNTSGNAWTTDGAFMLNISKGSIAGNILSPSQRLSVNATANIVEQTFLNYLPVTAGSLPISEAIGICDSPIPANQFTADAPQLIGVDVRLVKINGSYKKFTAGSYVTVGSNWFPEQAQLLSVVDTGVGTQTLAMKLRNPSGIAIVFQGGIAGQFISFDANLAFSQMRSSYFAFGSLTGSDLIYGLQVAGSVEIDFTLPMIDNEATMDDGGPNSGFHLFPGAEVVCNADQGFDCTLEQNGVLWEAGDTVENPHYPIGGGVALTITKTQNSPSSPRSGSGVLLLSGGGTGFGGGNTFIARLKNENPPSMYKGAGGPLTAPGGIELLGPSRHKFYAEYAPESDGAVVYVNSVGTNPVRFGALNSGGGNLWFIPATGTWQFDGPVDVPSMICRSTLGVGGGAAFLSSRVQVTGTNDYAEITFTGVFDKQTQRIRVYDGGYPLNTSMYFDSLFNGGFNFRIPDANGTLQTAVAIDANGVHVAGTVDATNFSKNGGPLTTGLSGEFPVAGVTVVLKDGLIVGIK